jgi:hypothetical protein
MKITYTPNPLATIIELDDHDKEVLRLKLIIETLTERIVGAHVHLEEGASFDLVRARHAVEYAGMDRDADVRVPESVIDLTNELLGSHCGDCTCVPYSCSKCQAEDMLGIDTTKGLGKHEASKIDSSFKSGKNVDEVIVELENYQVKPITSPNFTQEMLDHWTPIWKEQASQAAVWLKAYKAEHFNTDRLHQQLDDPPSGNV